MASDKPNLHISVVQTKAVKAIDGTTFAASKDTMMNSKFINLIVDDFKQLEFKDPATGETLAYNLYIPKNYDSTKSYPLVLFMHDKYDPMTNGYITYSEGVTDDVNKFAWSLRSWTPSLSVAEIISQYERFFFCTKPGDHAETVYTQGDQRFFARRNGET